MIGQQTPREIKAQVRQAFAQRGVDVERWLDRQMARLNREVTPPPEAVESLGLIQAALRHQTSAKRTKRAAPRKKTV